MNYDKFKEQLGSWGEILKPFIVSENCDKIYAKLKEDAKKGVVICPDSKETFRAFKECPWDDLKAVFLLQDPYPWIKKGIKVADGIAMSCKWTETCQPSLENFYRGIEEDLYNGLNFNMFMNPDLTYLANQGILFLNTSLTVRAAQGTSSNIGSHKTLWWKFTNYVLSIIPCLKGTENVVYVLCGDEAKQYGPIFGPSDIVVVADHPARASYTGGKWKHNNVFSKINEIHPKKITWVYEEAPF
jgi:uracil-DNA glycosylase